VGFAEPQTNHRHPPGNKGSLALKILIIKPSSLGDVVQALPVAKRLQEKYPDARIDWLVNKEFGDILSGNPSLHTVYLWDRENWRRLQTFSAALGHASGVVKNLRAQRYDLVLDLQGLFRSGLLASLSCGKRIVGFADAREKAAVFYHQKVDAPVREIHSVERYLLAAGVKPSGDEEFPIVFSSEDTASTENLLTEMGYEQDRPLAILVPGARWESKRWPPGNFVSLAERLAENQIAQVGFAGARGEKRFLEENPPQTDCRIMDFIGKTNLKQLAYLLKKADIVVGNDSGPTHIAAAVETPVVAFYGPTSPRCTGPFGPDHSVLKSRRKCRPCFSRTCDRAAVCMADISVQEAYEACAKHLAAGATAKHERTT
jgi:heptosyltransferase-1